MFGNGKGTPSEYDAGHPVKSFVLSASSGTTPNTGSQGMALASAAVVLEAASCNHANL
jgi:hypothetical protein